MMPLIQCVQCISVLSVFLLPCHLHPPPNGGARLALAVFGQLLALDAGHVDVNLNPVQPRTGACPESFDSAQDKLRRRNVLLVAADHAQAARALLGGIAKVAAWAGILTTTLFQLGLR